jgi:hypothetical protein
VNMRAVGFSRRQGRIPATERYAPSGQPSAAQESPNRNAGRNLQGEPEDNGGSHSFISVSSSTQRDLLAPPENLDRPAPGALIAAVKPLTVGDAELP